MIFVTKMQSALILMLDFCVYVRMGTVEMDSTAVSIMHRISLWSIECSSFSIAFAYYLDSKVSLDIKEHYLFCLP